MMCHGVVKCEIYRDKRFCGKSAPEWEICDCRHARLPCEVGECGFEEKCPDGQRESVELMRKLKWDMPGKRGKGT